MGKATRENRDQAFIVYCEEGGNAERTRRRLRSEMGLSLTRKSLNDWIVKYKFKPRRIEVDAKRQADKDAVDTAWTNAVGGYLRLMRQYENYFESPEFLNEKGKPDDQAVYAYASITGHLRMYLRKLDYIKEDEKMPDQDVKKKAAEILRDVYGIGD